jgi:hypothetical protein
MRLTYSILELDRKDNSNLLRSQLTFLPEMPTKVCDGRVDIKNKIKKYPQYQHIFESVTNSGIMGLWVSLFNTWGRFLNSSFDAILILEDDVKLVDGFKDKLLNSLKELPQDWDLFSIGYRDLYLDYYNSSFDLEKPHVSGMFQTGDSWGVIYSKKFVKEILRLGQQPNLLFGLPDTAIFSLVNDLGYKAFSLKPSINSLLIHENNSVYSTLNNSPIVTLN